MENTTTIKVWDAGVRIFHWALVATFTVAYFTQEQHDPHTWAGYTLIGLLLFRLLWGFGGGRHARFSDFIYGPGAVISYLKGIAKGRPPHYEGHNPAGGWMIVLMLITLVLLSFTGLKALALEGEGPFADAGLSLISSAYAHGNETHKKPTEPEDESPATTTGGSEEESAAATQPKESTRSGSFSAEEEEPYWSELHDTLSDIMLLLIAIHISGVVVSSALHRENLIWAMISGRKKTSGG